LAKPAKETFMPCRDEWQEKDYIEQRTKTFMAKLNAATRAACDMRTILRRHSLEDELCEETRKWIEKHDTWDKKRIKKEDAQNIRQELKKKALGKLSMDERRVLGL
jgi:hypothetical protein